MPAEPTFAEQMVSKYEALLLACAGATSINTDGETLSLANLEDKHRYWKSIVAREQQTRPTTFTIDMSCP